jgi:hypothetical protein
VAALEFAVAHLAQARVVVRRQLGHLDQSSLQIVFDRPVPLL